MKIRIWLAMAAIYVVWGSTYLAIRFAVETIPPFLMAGFRFLISGLILYLWRRSAGDPKPTLRQWRSASIIGLLLLLGGNGLLSWAEQHVASGISALMVATIPLWMVAIGAVRPGGRKPDWKIVLGLIIGFGGIALLVSATQSRGSSSVMSPVAMGALLLAALFWSLGSVYGSDADMPASSLLGTGMEMLTGAAGLLAVATVAGEWSALAGAHVSLQSAGGLLYLVAFGSLVGFVAYTWLLRNAPLPLVSTYAFVNPVIAVFLGAWLGGELLNARILLAAFIIVASVVVINLSKMSWHRAQGEAAAGPAD